jgi:hypothetical protein
VKICKRLLSSNPEACLILSRLLLSHLREHVDCVSMYLFVQQVMTVPAFELVFLQNRGAHFLIDFYEKTCVILHGRQYDRSLDFSALVEKGPEDFADAAAERGAQAREPSSNNSDEHLPMARSSERVLLAGDKKDGPSTNSETGDDESSTTSVIAAPVPAVVAHTPRTEQREVRGCYSGWFAF